MGEGVGQDVAAVADAAYALSDRTRLRLLLLLVEGEANVSDLCGRLGCRQPTASHHLAILRAAGMVRARRDGKQVFYRASEAPPAPGGLRVRAGGCNITVLRR